MIDENGNGFDNPEWSLLVADHELSNGERCLSANALQIAMDVMRGTPHSWTERDIALAVGMIGAIRGQQGVFSPDAEVLGFEDGMNATHQIDIWVCG